MNAARQALLAANGGVLSRADALTGVPHHVLDHAVASGQLARPLPRVYVDPSRAAEPWTRMAAALRYAGTDAALSHVTALGVCRLPGGDLGGPVHVMVPQSRRPRGTGRVIVHRRRDFDPSGHGVVTRRGLRTCGVESAVVDSWRLLPVETGRAAVIGAVGERLTTPARLLATIDTGINLPRRYELVRLANLLALGCRSELELWGYDHVFTGPGMPVVERNVRLRVGGRFVYLDVYCREARVDFELDGAGWHTSTAARERDARRDAALAAMGIMVVRFTHHQLVRTPDLVRSQVRAIVAARLL